jgi:hypothetical protein
MTAIRRRDMSLLPAHRCWVDLYSAVDPTSEWRHVSRVCDTGVFNGNPPSLLCIGSLLICVVGDRSAKCSMIAWCSDDEGVSWKSTVLRSQFYMRDTADFGYPRICTNKQGQIVVVYYWASSELPIQHIEATILQLGE